MQVAVDLWHVRTDAVAGPELLEACARVMSPAERERQERFVFERDRHVLLVTRALARGVLGEALGRAPSALDFHITEHGQPLLVAGGDVRFNLTNTLHLVVCAVARGHDVGVDAEPLSRARAILDLAETVFTPAERAALGKLSSRSQERRAVELWTLKEAYMKERGLGMAIPPLSIEVSFDDRGAPMLAGFTFTTREIEEHLVSVCARGSALDVRAQSADLSRLLR